MGRLSSPVLVGRDEELARLRTAWQAARQGRPSLVLVGGDAGVGKSRLTDELIREIREDDGRVLVGACIDVGDGGVPFAALTDALRGLAHGEDAARLPELLGPARRQLARLVPALGGDPSEGEPPSPVVVLQAALDAIGRLGASSPVLFVIEDIHWADRSTLDLLGYLARTIRDERVLTVATYRTDELHRRHQLRPFLAELSRARTIERIDLAPFDREQLASQMAAILDATPPAHLVEEVLVRSDGNPFLAEELLAAREDSGAFGLSVGLRDILDARIASLPPTARRVLDVAATIGRTAHHELLTAVGADVTDDLRDGLRMAVDHQVLVPEAEGRYRFRHALVQEAVHDELLPGERIELHRAVAAVLEDRPELASGGEGHVHAELAHHWEQSGDRGRAYRAALRAAVHAQGLPGYPEALTHFERSLALRPHLSDEELQGTEPLAEILERTVASALGAGDLRRGIAHQRTLLELVPEDDVEDRADVLRGLAHLYWYAGDGQNASRTIHEAAKLVADRPPSPERAAVLAYVARLAALQGRPEEGIEAAEEAVRIADEAGDDAARSQALNSLALIRADLGDTNEGERLLFASLEAARAAGDPNLEGTAYNNLVSILSRVSEPHRLVDLRQEVEDFLEGYEQHAGAAYVMANLADLAMAQGDVEGAAALLRRVARHRLDGAFRMNYLSVSSWIATMQGDFERAEQLGAELRQEAAGTPDPQTWVPLLLTSAIRALLRDRPSDALAALDEIEERVAELPRPIDYVVPLMVRVWALSELGLAGDDEASARARAVLDQLVDFEAGRAAGTIREGSVELARAFSSRLDAPDPDAWAAAAAAPALPWSRAIAMLGEAEALTTLDRRDEATERVREVYEFAERTGLVFARERAVDLARRARLALDVPELRRGPGDLGLTPREQEVLELVAEGRTNREIGEQLFITEKTASVHVSNILTKLGVDNRVEAAATAHRLGLTARD